ncbi:Nodulin-26 [Sesamum alatum]|uniref:Nodulin-26 n=1 Tax=Sesamum alatum TaxID=300844 RepID=A0AAE2CNC8_9LAMI|nr:Nodulin-26 [Sesamum alatum]
MVPGQALMAMIYAAGHVSGAHFDPAVTVAFAVARKLPLLHVPMYVLSQLFGSTLASLTLRVLLKDQRDDVLPMLTQYSSTSTTHLEAIVWEFIITFILIFTICGVASDDRANNGLCGVAIGGALSFNILIAGQITGASMNPARSLGPAVVSGVYKNQWVYVVAPILGAMAASLIYNLLRSPTLEKSKRDSRSTIYNDLYLEPDV